MVDTTAAPQRGLVASVNKPHSGLASYEPRKLRMLLAERMIFSDAVSVVAVMLSGYANKGDVTKSYISTLAETLARFPRYIVERAGDPQHGVPSVTKFLPTPADIIEWCDREVEWARSVVARDDRERVLAQEARDRATAEMRLAEARKLRPSLPELQ